eukprot:COSAG04_NODE_2515_length_3985_cov_6.505661_1_plen_172_part_00
MVCNVAICVQMDTLSGLSQLRSEGLLLGIRHLIEHSLEILLGVLRVDLVLQPLELLRTPTASSASARERATRGPTASSASARERATRGRGALTIFSAIWSICPLLSVFPAPSLSARLWSCSSFRLSSELWLLRRAAACAAPGRTGSGTVSLACASSASIAALSSSLRGTQV